MGPADDRAPSGCFDLVETDRQPEIPQPLQESRVAVGPVQPEPFELRLQWPFAGLDEVGEDVHGPGRERTRDLTARNEPEAEALGAGSGLGHTGETVVVGQRDRCAACGCGELDDSFGSLRAVGARRVQVQVDHGAERTGGRSRSGEPAVAPSSDGAVRFQTALVGSRKL